MKKLFIAITKTGILVAGDAAKQEASDFPQDVAWSGEITSVVRVEEVVRLAVDASFTSGLRG
ncbi:MAG: hypothetical protein M0P69_21150 [Bacteroidales bacterium]|nr:hypothetical protein [Bacteroidales bacterium]